MFSPTFQTLVGRGANSFHCMLLTMRTSEKLTQNFRRTWLVVPSAPPSTVYFVEKLVKLTFVRELLEKCVYTAVIVDAKPTNRALTFTRVGGGANLTCFGQSGHAELQELDTVHHRQTKFNSSNCWKKQLLNLFDAGHEQDAAVLCCCAASEWYTTTKRRYGRTGLTTIDKSAAIVRKRPETGWKRFSFQEPLHTRQETLRKKKLWDQAQIARLCSILIAEVPLGSILNAE